VKDGPEADPAVRLEYDAVGPDPGVEAISKVGDAYPRLIVGQALDRTRRHHDRGRPGHTLHRPRGARFAFGAPPDGGLAAEASQELAAHALWRAPGVEAEADHHPLSARRLVEELPDLLTEDGLQDGRLIARGSGRPGAGADRENRRDQEGRQQPARDQRRARGSHAEYSRVTRRGKAIPGLPEG